MACKNFRKVSKTVSLFGTSLAFYRGQKGLSLENPERSLKRGSRGPAPGSKKLENESKNDHFSSFFSGFGLVFNSFSSFFDPGGTPFRLLSGFSRERPF